MPADLRDDDPIPLGAPHRTPQRAVEVAAALAGCAAAAYVIDLDGSGIILLEGESASFPDRIQAPLGVGPELPLESLPAMRAAVRDVLVAAQIVPLRARGRVLGLLVTLDEPAVDLQGLADQVAVALELDSGYSDVLHGVRRRKEIQPAAEIQQDLLPPRVSYLEGGHLAGGVLPGYDVGGDFFDHAGNPEGVWLIVADAVGKGNMAAAMSSLAVGALRAARRSGAGLAEAADVTHEAVLAVGDAGHFLTAVIAIWESRTGTLRWTTCGHPPPLVHRAGGAVEELVEARTYPLGILERERDFPVAEAHVGSGDRLVIYSDGVTERRDPNGAFFGVQGVRTALTDSAGSSAPTTVRVIQNAVIGAATSPMRDDATLLVLVPD